MNIVGASILGFEFAMHEGLSSKHSAFCEHGGRAHDAVVVFINVHMQVCSRMTDMGHLQT